MTNKIVTVNAQDLFDLCTANDVGGTQELPAGRYRVRLEKSWNDYEIGRRCIGILIDAKDVDISRKVGTTAYGPKKSDWQPERVYFAARHIERKKK